MASNARSELPDGGLSAWQVGHTGTWRRKLPNPPPESSRTRPPSAVGGLRSGDSFTTVATGKCRWRVGSIGKHGIAFIAGICTLQHCSSVILRKLKQKRKKGNYYSG